MWTAQFWKDAAERGVKSAAQALILAWPVGDGVFNVLEVNAHRGLGIAAGAFALSLLTSLATGWTVGKGTASAVDEVVYAGRHAAP